MIWFAADLHLGHWNIVKYCKRPFTSVAEMDKALIENWNSVVGKDDFVYHLGDFALGSRDKIKFYEDQLNGKIIHIKGNHDNHNFIGSNIQSAVIEMFGKRIRLVHNAYFNYTDDVDIVLCGHVHDKWKWFKKGKIDFINVGVDAWFYHPIGMKQIVKFLKFGDRYDEKKIKRR